MKLRDIAKAAGVSLTTVSLVLNNKPGVGAEKREQVERLLRENGYRSQLKPDPACTQNILFLKYSRHSYLVNGNPGFVSQIMDTVEAECRKRSYNLVVLTFTNLDTLKLQELMRQPVNAGAILLGTEIEDADMIYFTGIEKPLVVVDNSLSNLPFSAVTMNNRDAVFQTVEYLKSLGHRRIGFLYNSIPSNNDRERRKAFEEALHSLGIPFHPELVLPIFPTMDGARESVRILLEKGVRFPPALVANNDSIAIGALRALRDRGIHVPEDISLVGFDGLPFSAVSDPPLTTVNVPCADIGHWAVQILQKQIQDQRTIPCKMLVGTELLVRGSTGPFPMSTDGHTE